MNEDRVAEDLRKVEIFSEANKKNEFITNQGTKGGSNSQVRIGPVRPGLEKGKGSLKVGLKERRVGNKKVGDSVGPKHQTFKPNRPTRGLIFGPTRGEVELSESGKRLWIEKSNVGRLGGSFTMDGDEENAVK